jgi:hypothetical protein
VPRRNGRTTSRPRYKLLVAVTSSVPRSGHRRDKRLFCPASWDDTAIARAERATTVRVRP